MRSFICLNRPQHAAGVGPTARRYRSIAARPAVSSECEQCFVVSVRRKLIADLFTTAMCRIAVQRCVRQYNDLLTKEKPSHVVIEEVKVRKLIA